MHMIPAMFLGVAIICAAPPDAAGQKPACAASDVPLSISPPADNDRAELSGVALKGDLLLTISNEALDRDERRHSVQIFQGGLASGYRHLSDALLFEAAAGVCGGADFEALARDGDVFFAITSHSLNRGKQKPDQPYEKNRRRLARGGIEACKARYQLRKFRLGDRNEVKPLQETSLRDLIARHPVLAPFATLPSKENGVDIEGMAATPEALFIGFRGPVLRQNYVPILRIPTDLSRVSLKTSEVLFVDLGGRGIRDMTPGPGGFYILAGPNGDEGQSFAIYFWDGQDQVGGIDHPARTPDLRCELEPVRPEDPNGPKPEGIAFLDATGDGTRFVLVYDGPAPLKAELRTLK